MKIYLGGPMRDLPEFNFPAFHEAAAALRKLGHTVFSPAERDNSIGFNPSGMAGRDEDMAAVGFNVRDALAADLDYICREAEMVVVLPGWESSKGCNAEVATAQALGIAVRPLAEALGEGRESPRGSALTEARQLITGDRNSQYGPPTEDFRRTAGMATEFGFRFVPYPGADPVPLCAHHVAVFMTLLKTSRLAWTPAKRDSWVDIAGYAGCGYECAVEEAS